MGDRPVCFFRESLINYNKVESNLLWEGFTADLSVGRVTESNKAGLFSFRLMFRDVTEQGALDRLKVPSWSQKSPRTAQYTLRCCIYQCESLPPADKTGTSDPYVEVWS